MKVLAIVSRRYNYHEFWASLAVLQERGHEVVVVSSGWALRAEKGYDRAHKAHHLLSWLDEADLSVFDGLIVISGNPSDTEGYWHNETVLRAVEKFKDRPIGAICQAVPTIRFAVRGTKVSYYPVMRAKALLEEAGAIPNGTVMTRDGLAVTASYEVVTQTWATEYCNLLEGLPQEYFFHEDAASNVRGKPRREPPEIELLKRRRTDGDY